jgi:hypothetical protein
VIETGVSGTCEDSCLNDFRCLFMGEGRRGLCWYTVPCYRGLDCLRVSERDVNHPHLLKKIRCF